MKNTFYIKCGKRIFDFVFSLVGIIVLSPLFAVFAVLVKLQDGGPVLYKQIRFGQYFRKFVLYKFRTMRQGADKDGNVLTVTGDERVTALGKFMRLHKFDELPQLFNVLKGDMSFVGPRPQTAKYVDIFFEDYGYILSVKPGITDISSVEYRNEEAVLAKYTDHNEGYIFEVFPEKRKLIRKYIENISFKTDIYLIFRTFLQIVMK